MSDEIISMSGLARKYGGDGDVRESIDGLVDAYLDRRMTPDEDRFFTSSIGVVAAITRRVSERAASSPTTTQDPETFDRLLRGDFFSLPDLDHETVYIKVSNERYIHAHGATEHRISDERHRGRADFPVIEREVKLMINTGESWKEI